jgi:predicted nucleic acid-binding protein
VTDNVLLDTGPLVALLDRREQHHGWAKAQVGQVRAPMFTCESVFAEAFHLLRTVPQGRLAIMDMLRQRLLLVRFRLDEQQDRITALLRRYGNVPMSLADACLVRMSELIPGSSVFTLDGDFRIYRRHGRKVIPVLMP